MRERRILLVIFLFFSVLIIACRKNRTIAETIPPPEVPGKDTPPAPPDTPNIPGPVTYNQVAVFESMGKNTGGYYEALPVSYDSTDKKYPLLLFLHGGGELGDGSPDSLPLILKNSLTKRLFNKSFPTSFTSDGKQFEFIIISPQFKVWPKVEDVHDIMNYVTAKYRIDPTRVYLSGLSMGGGVTWEYAGSKYGKSLAAIVPICGASWADSTVARKIASNEVPAWAFHNEDDDAVTVNSTKRYARLVNAEHPAIPVKVTLWPTGGHDAWTKASDPEFREENKNMYEWMLQYVRE
jgi:predicted peptidase